MVKRTIVANILTQCDSVNGMNQPYKPCEAFGSRVAQCVLEGWLSRGVTGGFWITAQGRRELARQK